MPSQLKSDTAPINGATSHGPKTAETRAISSQNALRHGFTASHTTLIECESHDEFESLLTSYFETYKPAYPAQENLVNEIISSRWRIRRMRVVETKLIDLEMIRNKPEVDKIYIAPNSTVHLAEAFRTLLEDARSLS